MKKAEEEEYIKEEASEEEGGGYLYLPPKSAEFSPSPKISTIMTPAGGTCTRP